MTLTHTLLVLGPLLATRVPPVGDAPVQEAAETAQAAIEPAATPTYTAPDAVASGGETGAIWMVARDQRGGTSWRTVRVRVVP